MTQSLTMGRHSCEVKCAYLTLWPPNPSTYPWRSTGPAAASAWSMLAANS